MTRNDLVKRGAIGRKGLRKERGEDRKKEDRGVKERIDRSKLIGRAKYNKTDTTNSFTYVDYLN